MNHINNKVVVALLLISFLTPLLLMNDQNDSYSFNSNLNMDTNVLNTQSVSKEDYTPIIDSETQA